MQDPRQCRPINDLGVRGLAWIFVGVIYAFIFVAVAESTRTVIGSPANFLLAALAASTLTALFYGSMRLVVLIANVILIATLLFLLLGRDSGWLTLPLLILIPALLGMLIGAVYGWRDRRSNVCCADAKTVAGLFTGALTALLAALVFALFGSSDSLVYPWLVMCLAPLAGALYVSTACWFVQRLENLLPPIGDGALVGLGVGAITGLLFVVIATNFEPDITGHGQPLSFIANLHQVLGPTLLGTAASCFALGVARALLRLPWYRL